jgi:phosphoribosylglycinamide formyltransferase-1
MADPISIVVLISGGGSNLQAIIDEIAAGRVNARIAAVISNKAQAYGLVRAEKAGLSTEVIDHTAFESREAFDEMLASVIDIYQPDLVVLAGFMRILTAGFVEHYQGEMLNIHPSLLPKYRGINTHQRALEAGDKEHGLSIHFVTPELDGGPVILQAYVDILSEDTADVLANRVLEQEHVVYPMVIDWFARGRVSLLDNQIIFDGIHLEEPIEHRPHSN